MFLRSGGVFCKGGYGRVAEAYCEAVRRYGSSVQMATRIEKILVENGRVAGVQTKDGSTFRAPVVISNAGIQPTVLKLVGEEHFDADYAQYVKDLVPSYALLGYRYFLSGPVTDKPYGVVFSDTSPWSRERLDKAATQAIFANSPFIASLNLEVLEMDYEAQEITIRMPQRS